MRTRMAVQRSPRVYPRPLPARADDHARRSGRFRRGPHRAERLFQPGDPVPESGIYEIIHRAAHRALHEAVMHARDPFPVCDTCGAAVRFRLVRSAPYIFDDEDFAPET